MKVWKNKSFDFASSIIFERTSPGEGSNSIFMKRLETCQIKKNRATEAILKIALDLLDSTISYSKKFPEIILWRFQQVLCPQFWKGWNKVF